MLSEERTEHLKLCRELYGQLCRIHAHKEPVAAAAGLPIDLPMFMRNFDRYVKWVERNSKVVDIAVWRPPVHPDGEPA